MSEDLDKLRELAEAATPGPWFQSGSPWFQTGGFVLAGSPDPHAGTVLADLSDTWELQRSDDGLDGDYERDPDKDAAFIAAFNPATALSLLSRLQAAEERADLWVWLAKNTNLELDHRYEDEDDDDDGTWRVHRVNGGVNDREWTLVAKGRTPLEAVQRASAALKTDGEGWKALGFDSAEHEAEELAKGRAAIKTEGA